MDRGSSLDDGGQPGGLVPECRVGRRQWWDWPIKLMNIFGMVACLFCPGCKPAAPSPTDHAPQAEMMRKLRMMMLTTAPTEFGIQPTKSFPRVFGVVMDWPLGEQTVTVVSMCDGNASLYTTSTFGVLGGVGHESVRSAATNFVRVAERRYDRAVPTKEFPYPATGHVRFYLVCFDGVRVIDARADELANGADEASDLWTVGQRVVTELRLVSERADTKP